MKPAGTEPPSISQSMGDPRKYPDPTAACLMAAGLRPEEIPSDPLERRDIFQQNPDARLALHALANVFHEANPRILSTQEWRDYRAEPEAERFLHDNWCHTLAGLMTPEELEDWTKTADRHLRISRAVRKSVLPRLEPEFAGEKLMAMTVGEAVHLHWLTFGHPPEGDFPLTIMEACRQRGPQDQATPEPGETDQDDLPF